MVPQCREFVLALDARHWSTPVANQSLHNETRYTTPSPEPPSPYCDAITRPPRSDSWSSPAAGDPERPCVKLLVLAGQRVPSTRQTLDARSRARSRPRCRSRCAESAPPRRRGVFTTLISWRMKSNSLLFSTRARSDARSCSNYRSSRNKSWPWVNPVKSRQVRVQSSAFVRRQRCHSCGVLRTFGDR
jgi:hypothetical protein